MFGHPEVGWVRNRTFAPIMFRRVSQEQTGIQAILFFLFLTTVLSAIDALFLIKTNHSDTLIFCRATVANGKWRFCL
jgi:hypothetical protein